MKNTKLIIGRIPYANLFPVFYYLDRKYYRPAYRFIKGVPSTLNRLLREGKLDISPSSSIEFIRNRDRYRILPSFSISSFGPIGSILLFSKDKIDRLGGKSIAVSAESETSVALLKVILKEFYALKCRFISVKHRSVKTSISEHSAVLFIGDTAMIEAKKNVTDYGSLVTDKKHTNRPKNRIMESGPPLYIYDLGEVWYRHTGLPFVFALWIAREDAISEKKTLVKKLSIDLMEANRFANKKLTLIAKEYPHRNKLTEKELVAYWRQLSYDLTDKHMEALKLFEEYIGRL